jgi:hypothetical protein
MRKTLVVLLGAGTMLFATDAFAICSNGAGALGGAAAGAATGAVVGGPVGAAVGGVIGGAVGSQALPPTSCSYVVQQDVPVAHIEQRVVVGEPLPETVELHAIPDTQAYVFADVNDQRLIVDPRTHVVLEVVD